MTNQTIVKINEVNAISVLEHANGVFELAHLVNGEISYKHIQDVITVRYESQLEAEIQELAWEIVGGIINEKYGYIVEMEVDDQIIIDFGKYSVWIAVSFYGDSNKITYEISTIRVGCEDDDKDKNVTTRKTFNGLMNTVNRFDV